MWTKSWMKKFREVPRFSSIRNSKDNLEFFTWIDANIILVEKLDTFCTISDKKILVTFLTVASPKLARLAHSCLHTDENPPRGEEAIRGVFREARRLHGHPLCLSGIPERVISPNEMNYSFLQTGPNLAPTIELGWETG